MNKVVEEVMNDLEQIEGIGPKTKELLEKLRIFTIEDLVNHYPFRYEVLKRSNMLEIKDGDKIIIASKDIIISSILFKYFLYITIT